MAWGLYFRSSMTRVLFGLVGPMARGIFVVTLLLLGADLARAEVPTVIRVVLHDRGPTDPGATYVDISVRGTVAPIRLVRRVAGTCAVVPSANPAELLVSVECTVSNESVRFIVAHVDDEVVVRRSVASSGATPDAGGDMGVDAGEEMPVIARATLRPGSEVRVE